MNNRCHRIIFNHCRGLLMAVAESASSRTKSPGESRSGSVSPRSAVPFTAMATACATAAAWLVSGLLASAMAQIIADPSAPASQRPTVLVDGAGRPSVNIQTPSAAGVSRNTYTQFDVQSNGAVLNNSRLSNPWLATGEARVILNEVNSSNPSYLRGAITVQGMGAQVVVANPAGIQVDGASFVNATRATLTTGVPTITNGDLTGFQVREGTVNIQGGGLNVQGVSYTEILSRAAVIAGRIDANPTDEVAIIAGPQEVDYRTGNLTVIEGAPAISGYAIDAATLGGMYAGKITLLATEAGVGVRNAGTLQSNANSSAGQIFVTADGRLENTGSIRAGITSLATVTDGISNSGELSGSDLLVISSGQDFTQSGIGINLDATTPGRLIVNARRDVALNQAAQIRYLSENSQLSITAGRNMTLDAGSAIRAGGPVQLSAGEDVVASSAAITSDHDDLQILAGGAINLESSDLSGNRVHAETGRPFEESTGAIEIRGGRFAGVVQTTAIASGNLSVTTASPAAVISGSGDIYLKSGNDLTVGAGVGMNSGQDTAIIAQGSLMLEGVAGLDAATSQYVNLVSQGSTSLLGGQVTISGAKVSSGEDLSIESTGTGIRLETIKGAQQLYAYPSGNVPRSLVTPTFTSAGDTTITAYEGEVYTDGVKVSARDIAVSARGDVRGVAHYDFLGDRTTAIGSTFQGSGDITFFSQEGSIRLLAPQISASGAFQAKAKNSLTLDSAMNWNFSASYPTSIYTVSRGSIAADDVHLQATSISLFASNINATDGHIGIVADYSIQASAYDPSWRPSLTATGNVALQSGNLNLLNGTSIDAGGSVALTSRSGGVSLTDASSVRADGMVSISSKGAQKISANIEGGAVSIFNEQGLIELSESTVRATQAEAAALSSVSGMVSVESGGHLRVLDEQTRFIADQDLHLSSAAGDITITTEGRGGNPRIDTSSLPDWLSPEEYPADPDNLILARSQVQSGRSISFAARGGDLIFDGHDGVAGMGSESTVRMDVLGNISLVGRNVRIKGADLGAAGHLSVVATDGDVTVDAVRVTSGMNVSWKQARLEAGRDPEQSTDQHFYSPYGVDFFRTGGELLDIKAIRDVVVNGSMLDGSRTQVTSGRDVLISGVYGRTYASSGSSHYDYTYLIDSGISGVRGGVTIGALGGHLVLNSANIFAIHQTVNLQALGDVRLEASSEHELYHSRTNQVKRKWYGAKTTYTTSVHRESMVASPVAILGGEINIKAGGSVHAYATDLSAIGIPDWYSGDINVVAGDGAYYYAVRDQLDNRTTTQKTSSLWGIKFSNSTTTNSRSTLGAQVTTLQSTGSIQSLSGGDQLLQGTEATYSGTATFQVGVGEQARADARLILEGVVNSVTQSRTKESNYVIWQRQLGEGSTVETLKLPSFNGPSAPAFVGPVLADIPAGDFTSQVQSLSQLPGMSYIGSLAQRNDVNWQPVKLAYESWQYEQEGLTAAGAALLGAAVALAMPASFGADLLGIQGGGIPALMADAAFNSLAAQAAIVFVNNKGDIGKTLRDLGSSDAVKAVIAAALTAGVLESLTAGSTELSGIRQQIRNGQAGLSENLTFNLINAGGRALTNTVVSGGDLETALKSALLGGLVDTAHGGVASTIKGIEADYLVHKLAHALAGCVAGAAAGGECRDGAIGGAVGEVVAELFKGQKPDLSTASYSEINAYREKVVGYSKLVAGALSAYAGGDAQTAIATAETAVRNNYLNHYKKNGMLSLSEVEQYNQASAACQSGDAAACDRRDTLAATSLSRDRALSSACGDGPTANPVTCNTLVREARDFGNVVNGTYGGFVWANSPNRSFALNVSTASAPVRSANFHDALAKSTASGLALVVNGPEDLIVGAIVAYGGRAAVVAMEGTQKVLLLPNNLVIKVDSIDWTKQAFMPGLPMGAVSGVNLQTGELVVRMFGGKVVSYGNNVELAPVLNAADNSTVWVTDITVQGQRGENLLGRQDRGIGLHRNEAVIDVWDPINGLAISQKTLNWNAPTYANSASAVESQLKTYVDQLAVYQGTGESTLIGFSERILATQINSKALEIVLPSTGGSRAHIDAVNRVIDYARLNGIDAKIYKAN